MYPAVVAKFLLSLLLPIFAYTRAADYVLLVPRFLLVLEPLDLLDCICGSGNIEPFDLEFHLCHDDCSFPIDSWSLCPNLV